jgi:hypothetical protein
MPSWVGPAVVAPCWGVWSVQLLVLGWLATADLFIAIVALARGRMTAGRAVGRMVAALVTGLVCSVLFRGGFWLLVEVMAFGRTGLEQAIYCVSVAVAAGFMLRRLPSRVQKSWRAAMDSDRA